jgi:hypothetical protein
VVEAARLADKKGDLPSILSRSFRGNASFYKVLGVVCFRPGADALITAKSQYERQESLIDNYQAICDRPQVYLSRFFRFEYETATITTIMTATIAPAVE